MVWRKLTKVDLLQSQAIFFFLSSSERLCEEKGPKDQGDTSSRKGMLQHKEDAQCTTYAVE